MAMMLGAVGGIIGAIGSIMSAQATLAAGKMRQQAAEYEAKQLEIKGQEQRAAAQRQQMEVARQGDVMQSALQTAAAASGTVPTSEDILDLSGDLASAVWYRSGIEGYKGHEQRLGSLAQAESSRLAGEIAMTEARGAAMGHMFNAASTIVGSVGGLFSSGMGSSTRPSYVYGSNYA